LALANAVPYMQAFGHAVIAWVWLQVAMASQGEGDANLGRRQACQFFFHYELPKIGAWLNVVNSRDNTCAHTPEAAF
jgi:butyryl-CoA dehydrogenase